MIFLNFGAGVQSSTLLMLALRGEIERPDHVIWADTGFEPRAVYRHAEWSRRQCEKAGLPFHAVKATANLRESFEAFERGDKPNWSQHPPLYIETTIDARVTNEWNDDGDEPSKTRYAYKVGRGTLGRNCTRDVKIQPIRRKTLELMGYRSSRGVPDGEAVTMIGISTDEARRASPSREAWQDIIYPLIDPLKMSRLDCQRWWENHYPHIRLPSSSCTICPYKSPSMWRRLKDSDDEDWREAVEYDERIRAAYAEQGRTVYLHRDYVPLSRANLNEAQSALDLEDSIYCAGGCGL